MMPPYRGHAMQDLSNKGARSGTFPLPRTAGDLSDWTPESDSFFSFPPSGDLGAREADVVPRSISAARAGGHVRSSGGYSMCPE